MAIEEELKHKRSTEKLAAYARLYGIGMDRMHEILFSHDHGSNMPLTTGEFGKLFTPGLKRDMLAAAELAYSKLPKQENKMELRTRPEIEIKPCPNGWMIESLAETTKITDYTTNKVTEFVRVVVLTDDEIFAAAKFVKDTRKAQQKAKNKRLAAEKREEAKRLRRALKVTQIDAKEFKDRLKKLGSR